MDIRTPGSGLVERLKARERRRPKIGLSPMFYARFGLSDPWLDTSLDARPEDVESAFTLLSARPYFQMMRRRAMQRWWRQRRERNLASRRIGLKVSKRRRFPGETAVSAKPFIPPWGGFGPTIDMGSMALPEAWTPPAAEQVEEVSAGPGRSRERGPGAKVSDSPWLITPFIPARVFSSRDRVTLASDSSESSTRSARVEGSVGDTSARRERRTPIAQNVRQADRVGQRLAQVRQARDPIARALEAAPERVDARTRAAVKRALQITEWMEPEQRAVEIRRVLRARASARVVRTVFEDVMPEKAARPATVAAARMPGSPKKKAMGLRPVLQSSPLMSTVSPETSAPSAQQDQAPRPGRVARAAARPKPAAWALSRKYRDSSTRLTSSPVGRNASFAAQSAVPGKLSRSPMPRSAARAAARRVTRRSMMGTPDRAILTPTPERVVEQAPAQPGRRQATPAQKARPERSRVVTPVASTARVARTPSSERSASQAHRTPKGTHTSAQTSRTPASDRSASQAHRTPQGTHTGAQTSRTPAGDRSASASHRTPQGTHTGAQTSRTPAGDRSASASHRTPQGSHTGAQTSRTPAGDRSASASHRTPQGTHTGAQTSRTPAGDRSASASHRTPQGSHTGAQTSRTPAGDRTASASHRTPQGTHTGAQTSRTPAGDRSASASHRTPSGSLDASASHRTPQGDRSASAAHRTPAGSTSVSESHRTPGGEYAASDAHRTPGGDLGASAAHRTPAGDRSVSETHRTPSSDVAAQQPSALGAASVASDVARGSRRVAGVAARQSFDSYDEDWAFEEYFEEPVAQRRAAASAHAMERLAGFLGESSVAPRRSVGPLEAVLPSAAPGVFASASEEPRVGGVSWAAERLAQTGLPSNGRGSVLPRMAPVLRDVPVVVSVSSEAEAREVEAQVKKALPDAIVRVREASPWLITPYTPARVVSGGGRAVRSSVEAAVARQVESPITSESARLLSRSVSGRTPSSAVGRSRVRTTGPVQYASRGGPEQVALSPAAAAAAGAWAGAAVTRTASGAYIPASSVTTPSSQMRGAKVFRTEAGRYVSASAVKTPGSQFSASGVFRTPTGEYIAARGVRTGRSPFVGAPTATTLSGEWSGAESFRTPGGSTEASAGFRTPAGDRSAMSGVRTPSSMWQGAGAYLTPSGQWTGARSATTPAGDFVGARVGEGRPLDWVGARMSTTPSSGYRGAFSARTPDTEFIGAGAFRTPAGEFEGAPVASGGAGGRRVPGRRLPRRGARADLGVTLAGLSQGADAGLPGWADRAASPVAVRTVTEFVSSLARASDPTQVVEIILSRGQEVRGTSLLPKPVIRVIEQIQAATAAPEREALGTPGTVRGTTTRSTRGAPGSRRSSARVLSGWTGLPVGASAPSAQGVGSDRVAKLAKKLRNLIHLAENQNRLSDAQRQVRLAASDAPSARMGGGSEMGEAEAAEMANVDIEALGREVLELVNREQELRRERRPEASDGSSWW